MEQLRIIKEMREKSGKTDDNIRPRYMVWENVPGAFSSNGGEDFRIVLEETARVVEKDTVIPGPPKEGWHYSGCIMGDGWSIAWRVHDAQFWGVPQRRKRISLVADFNGQTAPEILFERESMCGDISKSGEKREETPGTVGESLAFTGGGVQSEHFVQGTIKESDVEILTKSSSKEPILLESNQNHATIQTDGISTALPASMGMGGGYVPMVVGVDGYNQSTTGEKAKSLTNKATDSDHVPCVVHPMTTSKASYTMKSIEDCGQTLVATDYKDPQIVCYGLDQERRRNIKGEAVSPTITERAGTGGNNLPVVCESYIVRRLTPLECTRLQGFPDGWVDIGEWTDTKGKAHKESDTCKYKALGNSIALPFWDWMAERMVKYIDHPTMASLFDGIGGFPYVFSKHDCKPIWASEVENFCIAVTKRRFPSEDMEESNNT